MLLILQSPCWNILSWLVNHIMYIKVGDVLVACDMEQSIDNDSN